MSAEEMMVPMFLMNAETFFAGSWRYDTYFCRDLVLTVMYLKSLLQPDVFEVLLSALFDGMDATGDPSHEATLGDKATRENIQAGRGAMSTPVHDYKMMDSAFLVGPLFQAYREKVGDEVARQFLQRRTKTGRPFTDALGANLRLVIARTDAFARSPVYQNLVSFKDGEPVGDWRDSSNGHGDLTDQEARELKNLGLPVDRTATGGRYSFGTNVALAPAALREAADLLGAPLGLADPGRARQALRNYAVWSTRARPLFEISVSAGEATRAARQFQTELGLPAPAPLDQGFRFSALSLDRRGRPIRAFHSDEGFDLLMNRPSEDVLNQVAGHLLRPQPYGLEIEVGMAIVNPMLITDEKMRRRFFPDQYHGYLVWGCEMAKMERGLATQLQRTDIGRTTRDNLEKAHRKLWQIIERARPHVKEELWSWKVVNAKVEYVPYEEANALQFWNLALAYLKNPYANDGARMSSVESGAPN